MQYYCWLDLKLPIVLHTFLVFYGAAGTIGAGGSNKLITDIAAAANAIDLHLVDDGSTE